MHLFRKAASEALNRAMVLMSDGSVGFAGAAAEVLRAFPCFSTNEFFDFLSSEAKHGEVVERHNPRFGQPSVILARQNDYFVEMLLWRDDITSIHEHSFEGAFKALHGRRLHATFEFVEPKCCAEDGAVFYGSLMLKDVESLSAGDIRCIEPGSKYIHMLWTLERPGLTVVLRQAGYKSSLSYVPPGLAFNEFSGEKLLAQYALALATLKENSQDKWVELLKDIFASIDLNGVLYFVLMLGLSPSYDPQLWEEIELIIKRRSPEFSRRLKECAEMDANLRQIASLRLISSSSEQLAALATLYLEPLAPGLLITKSFIPTLKDSKVIADHR